MPVFSYLAYPVLGAKEELLNDLAAIDYCEAAPAENQEILILVTDTPDEDKEKELKTTHHSLPAIYLYFGLDGHSALVPWIWTAISLNLLGTLTR